MRKALVAGFLCAAAVAPPVRAQAPRERVSPPGQISVVALNARQNPVVGRNRFRKLAQIGRILRFRPAAFDGGRQGGVISPDVLVLTEIRLSNVEILTHFLNQRYSFRYAIATAGGTKASIVYNSDTVDLISVSQWSDACTSADDTSDGRQDRSYPIARFTEKLTGTGFTVAGIHLAKNYLFTGQSGCFDRNIETLRAELAGETGPVIVGGDFNRRSVTKEHECDPNERSDPESWWSAMTATDEAGRSYIDAVRSWHRDHNQTLRHQWTHEQAAKTKACNGLRMNRRSRIDFLFASGAIVAQASADHPGWAGKTPGKSRRGAVRYSDHRFVWGRFVLRGPPPTARLDASPDREAAIQLAWEPAPAAEAYVVFRALPGHNYKPIARVPGETTEFIDLGRHGQRYRYSIAAVGPNGNQGKESRPASAVADAVGPRVSRVSPARRSRGVDRDSRLTVRFDQGLAVDRVPPAAIRLWNGSKRIAGKVSVLSPRQIRFKPAHRLPGKRILHVRVIPLWDRYGNRGAGTRWAFTTRRGRPA